MICLKNSMYLIEIFLSLLLIISIFVGYTLYVGSNPINYSRNLISIISTNFKKSINTFIWVLLFMGFLVAIASLSNCKINGSSVQFYVGLVSLIIGIIKIIQFGFFERTFYIETMEIIANSIALVFLSKSLSINWGFLPMVSCVFFALFIFLFAISSIEQIKNSVAIRFFLYMGWLVIILSIFSSWLIKLLSKYFVFIS